MSHANQRAGVILQQMRLAKNLSLIELATQLDWPPPMLQAMENGLEEIAVEDLAEVASALGFVLNIGFELADPTK